MNLEISARKITFELARCALFLVGMHIILQSLKFSFGLNKIYGLLNFFDLDIENNLPSAFAAFLFAVVSLLLAVIAAHTAQAKQKSAINWAFLAIIALFLSLDEALAIHEKWLLPTKGLLPEGHIFFHFWHLPYLILAPFIILAAVPVWKSLIPVRRWVILALILIGVGITAFELWGGWYHSSTGLKRDSIFYVTLATIEESLEMAGLIVFIHALLCYIQTEIKQVSIIK